MVLKSGGPTSLLCSTVNSQAIAPVMACATKKEANRLICRMGTFWNNLQSDWILYPVDDVEKWLTIFVEATSKPCNIGAFHVPDIRCGYMNGYWVEVDVPHE